MPTVPNSEPDSFTAGETVAWTKILASYPSGTYTLKYALQAPGKPLITITAGAVGDGSFAVNITAAVTAVYASGCYVWTAYAESSGGTVRNLVGRGTISILPSPLAALGTTHASQMLALIEAALLGRIPNNLQTTDIDGQRIDRIPIPDLHRLRQRYRAEVINEQKAAMALLGKRPRHSIGIRFVRA